MLKFLFSENHDLGESREESENIDQTAIFLNRKTYPLACSFKATIESANQKLAESTKKSLKSGDAQSALETWKFHLKTDELSVRSGWNMKSKKNIALWFINYKPFQTENKSNQRWQVKQISHVSSWLRICHSKNHFRFNLWKKSRVHWFGDNAWTHGSA